jgi:HEAT repeat protein
MESEFSSSRTGGPIVIATMSGASVMVCSCLWACATEDSAVPEHRPIVTAILVNGSTVEGMLLEFSNGEYRLATDGSERTIPESSIRRIAFRPQEESDEPAKAARPLVSPRKPPDPEIEQQIKAMMRVRHGQDEAAIARLAGMGPKVIDPLLAAVAENSDIYQAAAEVFVRMGPDVFPQLVDRARERDSFETVQPLQFALSKMREKGLPVIVPMLTDSDPRIRKLGFTLLPYAAGVGRALPQEVFAKVLEGVHDLNPDVQTSVCEALGQCHDAPSLSIPVLRRVLRESEHDQVRAAAASGLYTIGYYLSHASPEFQSVVEGLAEGLAADSHAAVRRSCAYSLGELSRRGDQSPAIRVLQRAVPALRTAANDPYPNVREAALETLHVLGAAEDVVPPGQAATPEQIATLVAQLSGSSRTQQSARRQLQELGPDRLQDVVAEVRKYPHMQGWFLVSYVLASWGEPVLPSLADLATDEKATLIRRIAAHAYGEMALLEVPGELVSLLRDDDHWVRVEAIRALAKLANQGRKESWSSPYRRYAQPAIQGTGEDLDRVRDAAVTLLAGELTSPNEGNRKEAVAALREIAPDHEKTAPAVIRVLAEDPSSTIRADAAYAFRDILSAVRENPEASDTVLEALVRAIENDEDDTVRRYALMAVWASAPQAAEVKKILEKASRDPVLRSLVVEFLKQQASDDALQPPPDPAPPADPALPAEPPWK